MEENVKETIKRLKKTAKNATTFGFITSIIIITLGLINSTIIGEFEGYREFQNSLLLAFFDWFIMIVISEFALAKATSIQILFESAKNKVSNDIEKDKNLGGKK